MKRLFFVLFAVLFYTGVQSQESGDEFKPSGKPFIKVFTNFHSASTDGDVHNAFEIQRAYFGYAYKMSKKFSGKVTLDVGNPKDDGKFEMTAFLKTAYFQYKSERLITKFGLIGRMQYKLQENLWGGRYLYKSFQDEHKFGPSADLGLYASYKLHDMVTVDASIENGEGYKELENDSVLKYSAGLIISPYKGLKVRAYYDYMGDPDAQQTFSIYAGYDNKILKVGAEYNQQSNYKMSDGKDRSGYSFFASYKIKKFRVFGRLDQLTSVTKEGETENWNYAGDGQGIIAGVEFSPVKGIKITPNYQAWLHDNDDPTEHIFYLSCEIKF